MYISPWKMELQAEAYLQLSYALYSSHIKLGKKKFQLKPTGNNVA